MSQSSLCFNFCFRLLLFSQYNHTTFFVRSFVRSFFSLSVRGFLCVRRLQTCRCHITQHKANFRAQTLSHSFIMQRSRSLYQFMFARLEFERAALSVQYFCICGVYKPEHTVSRYVLWPLYYERAMNIYIHTYVYIKSYLQFLFLFIFALTLALSEFLCVCCFFSRSSRTVCVMCVLFYLLSVHLCRFTFIFRFECGSQSASVCTYVYQHRPNIRKCEHTHNFKFNTYRLHIRSDGVI